MTFKETVTKFDLPALVVVILVAGYSLAERATSKSRNQVERADAIPSGRADNEADEGNVSRRVTEHSSQGNTVVRYDKREVTESNGREVDANSKLSLAKFRLKQRRSKEYREDSSGLQRNIGGRRGEAPSGINFAIHIIRNPPVWVTSCLRCGLFNTYG